MSRLLDLPFDITKNSISKILYLESFMISKRKIQHTVHIDIIKKPDETSMSILWFIIKHFLTKIKFNQIHTSLTKIFITCDT